MVKFEYANIQRKEDIMDREFYESEDFKSESLIEILNEMGDCRWELAGEFNGELIMKRIVL